jgi:hypothetical protein
MLKTGNRDFKRNASLLTKVQSNSGNFQGFKRTTAALSPVEAK